MQWLFLVFNIYSNSTLAISPPLPPKEDDLASYFRVETEQGMEPSH